MPQTAQDDFKVVAGCCIYLCLRPILCICACKIFQTIKIIEWMERLIIFVTWMNHWFMMVALTGDKRVDRLPSVMHLTHKREEIIYRLLCFQYNPEKKKKMDSAIYTKCLKLQTNSPSLFCSSTYTTLYSVANIVIVSHAIRGWLNTHRSFHINPHTLHKLPITPSFLIITFTINKMLAKLQSHGLRSLIKRAHARLLLVSHNLACFTSYSITVLSF